MVVIREISAEDLRQVAYIHVDTWRSAYKGIVDQKVLNKLSYNRSIENWKHCLTRLSQYFYVAEEDGAIVGFAVGGIQREEELLYDAEVYAMYIKPEFQRQGIGQKLIKALVKDFHVEGWQQFIVWCLKKNPSRLFYEKLGGQLMETAKLKIGGKPLIKNGYVYNTEDFIQEMRRQES